MTARRVGVLGGTFDPIHCGHLAAATAVADACHLDLVVFVPAGQPWHRAAPPVATGEQRAAMVALAIADDPRFILSTVDLERTGPTYTVDTLRSLRAAFEADHPGTLAEWTFITGADALMEMGTWKDPARIARLAHVVGVHRPGHRIGIPPLPEGSWGIVEIPGIDVSSTQVRRLLAAGESVAGLVPDPVLAYIRDQGLYRRAPA